MRLDNLVYATILGTGTLLGGQAITPGKVSASQQQVEKQEEQSLDEQVREYTTTNEDKPEYWYDKARNLREKAQSHKGSDTGTYKNLTDKAKDIFLKGVKKDMKKPNAEAILEPYFEHDLIEKVQYNPVKEETNFDELVYENNDPSLVLFYDPKSRDPDKADADKRASIIFKRLAEKYNDELDFYSFRGVNELDGIDNKKEQVILDKWEENNIEASPSIAMYSPYNILEDETALDNDGVVEQIDILKGGPIENKDVINATDLVKNAWIPMNITNPRDSYTGKFKNSYDFQKIKY